MSSAYLPVKVALCVILAVGLALAVRNVAPELNHAHRSNGQFIVLSILQIVVLIIGLIGSATNNRQYLLSYAISMLVMIILNVLQGHNIQVIGNGVLDLVSIFLALWQSEMIRGGC